MDGPLNVSQVAERASLSQPNTSNHLACLLGCGLVTSERHGRFVFYSHADEHVSLLLSVADLIASDPARHSLECPRCGTAL
jgi:DNA-binding transcriptional ArsR family regulator